MEKSGAGNGIRTRQLSVYIWDNFPKYKIELTIYSISKVLP